MLREQVLSSWKECKEKMISFKKSVDFLAQRAYLESPLPAFPTNQDIIWKDLNRWTSPDYLVRLEKNRMEILKDIPENENLSMVQLGLTNSIHMFKDLTRALKKSSGPTIEEVD